MKKVFTLLMSAMFLSHISGQENLDVIKNNWMVYGNARDFLYDHLAREAYTMLKMEYFARERLDSMYGWEWRKSAIRRSLDLAVGPFPAKTPLNPKITRTITKDGYRVEHILLESQPGYYVTSSLFIPAGVKKGAKLPAIIYCSGHSADGYRSAVYQRVILNLVKKNFIVFAFDPVGQGERLEYFDKATGKSIFSGPTIEHSYPGAQLFLSGSSMAKYVIWDGVRVVDYLLSRKEVDPARIGITGRSGGGTQSAYIAAFDDRIFAAAPECYITSFLRLLMSIGPQDAEQNFPGGVLRNIDHAQLLLARAPKPTLMITTTRDMFSIQGAMETEKYVSGIYRHLGKPENFSRVEDDAGHESTPKNRVAMYSFFQKHLRNPGNPSDEDIPLLSAEELKVTPTGVVSSFVGGETTFSLNRREAEKLEEHLRACRADTSGKCRKPVAAALDLSGYRAPEVVLDPIFCGRFRRDGYCIEKYFVKGEGEYVFPYLLMVPDSPSGRSLIYLHPAGKAAEAKAGGEMEWFVSKGFTVIAPDLLGTGETAPASQKGDAVIGGMSHNVWYASILIGRSIAGIRASDVTRLALLLAKRDPSSEIWGLARKEMTDVLLYAAAFNPQISRAAIIEPYSSYRSLVFNRFYYQGFVRNLVPGALTGYDLPDIAGTLAPRRLMMAGTTDGNNSTADTAGIEEDLDIVRSAYLRKNATNQLMIVPLQPDVKKYELFDAWIK